MNYFDIILQMILEDIQQQTPYLLRQLKQLTNSPEELLHELIEIDPTEKKGYIHKIIQWITNKEIRWPEDKEKLQQTIKDYTTLRKQYPNFKSLTKYSYHELTNDINKHFHPQELKTKTRLEKIPPKTEIIYNQPPYTILKITDIETAIQLASGTKWCTSDKNTATNYLLGGPLYVILKDGKKYAQAYLDPNDPQLKDIHDSEINDPILRNILSKLPGTLGIPAWTFEYAKDVIKGRWPEGEEIISRDAEYAFQYAKDIIKDRWPEGEKAILHNPYLIYHYAKDIIKDRWPEGEKILLASPKMKYMKQTTADNIQRQLIFQYAKDIIKGRWPEGEKILRKSHYWWDIYFTEFILYKKAI